MDVDIRQYMEEALNAGYHYVSLLVEVHVLHTHPTTSSTVAGAMVLVGAAGPRAPWQVPPLILGAYCLETEHGHPSESHVPRFLIFSIN